MIDEAELRDGLPLTGLSESDVPHVVAAGDRTRTRLSDARRAIAALPPCRGVPLALGSHGRHESGRASDLDFAYLHDPATCDAAEAAADRESCAGALRGAGFDVPSKTFVRAVALPDLLRHVGGPSDTHEHLTHRALVLTESAWLRDAADARAAWSAIFALYRDGSTRGRHMSSLLNDLHRYYRTVCLDYRHKIEEADRGWALRYLKLRHSRKTLHLSNLVLHCVTAARSRAPASELSAAPGFDALLAARLCRPPLLKIAEALAELGGGSRCAALWLRYDAFLHALDDAATREELEGLATGDEAGSAAFRALKDNARGLDDAAETIVAYLLEHPACRSHLVRFGLL